MIPQIPQRPDDAHKGDFGNILAVGGSLGMVGAIGMTGLAALRSGAGKVSLAVPDATLPYLGGLSPCLMSRPLPSDSEGKFSESAIEPILTLAKSADAVAIGPGMGQSTSIHQLVPELLANIAAPLVVDADGLNALANQTSVAFGTQSILTPHPGEFQRLAGREFPDRKSMETAATAFAESRQVVVVLKGHRTLVTDGNRVHHNSTGNPGMATGGSGDVLTGIIVALLGQGLEPFDAAALGCHLHGLAGDLAAQQIGEVSLIATDIIDYLPEAFKNN